MKKIIVFLILIIGSIPLFANVGDRFTFDGVNYQISSEGLINTVKVSGQNNYNNSTLTLPATVQDGISPINYRITAIDGGFNSNTLEIVDLSQSIYLDTIGLSAFRFCRNVKTINFPPNLKYIDKYAFAGLSQLQLINFPQSLEYIGEEAFAGCENIETIILPSSLKVIDVGAFMECVNLKTTDLTHATSVTTIQRQAFNQCTSLTSVDMSSLLLLKELGSQLFANCILLNNVILPPNLEEIGSGAFSMCTQLPAITFPPTLKIIRRSAFQYCHSFTGFTIPASVSLIEPGSFAICDNNKEFIVETGNNIYMSFEGILFTKDMKTLHTYPNLKANIYHIPDGVEVLEELAFQSCRNIEEIFFPTSLKIIRTYCFQECSNLHTADIKNANNLHTIENMSFAGCSELPFVIFPSSLRELGGYSFNYCRKLAHADFSQINLLTSINVATFSGCIMLPEVYIPASVKTINASAFSSCTNLTSVDFKDAVELERINGNINLYGAFENCKIKKVDLSNTKLSHIGMRTFSENVDLDTVLLPQSVKSIEERAFENCVSLLSFTNPNPIPQIIKDNVFTSVDKIDCDLLVAPNSLNDYINTPVWREFFYYRVTTQPNNINSGKTTGSGVFYIYDKDTITAKPEIGYEFMYWKDDTGNIISYDDSLAVTITGTTNLTAYFRDMNASDDATLFSLIPSHGVLIPDFDSNIFHYLDTVPYAVDSIQFYVVTNDALAVVNATDTTKKELLIGDNEFTITITAEDLLSTEKYTIKVYRLNNNAYLHDLSLNGVALSPVFDSLCYVYTATVPFATSSITINPTLSDPNGLIEGDYGIKNLSIGNNRFDILVRAEDRDTTRTYTVNLTRDNYPPSTEANVIQVNVNGTDLLSAPTNRFEDLYSGDCGEETFTVTLRVSEGSALDIDNPLTVSINKLVGLDTVNFTVRSESGLVTSHRLILEKRFVFDMVVETMWNDNTFMLDIRYLNENGIPVSYGSKYLWYKNGNPIFMGVYPTLSAGENATDHFEYGVPYYLEMTTDRGEKLRTCEKILTGTNVVANIYPNPAGRNEVFTIMLEESGGMIEIFNLYGVSFWKQAVTERELKLSIPFAGTYIIRHSFGNEKERVYKMIIQ